MDYYQQHWWTLVKRTTKQQHWWKGPQSILDVCSWFILYSACPLRKWKFAQYWQVLKPKSRATVHANNENVKKKAASKQYSFTLAQYYSNTPPYWLIDCLLDCFITCVLARLRACVLVCLLACLLACLLDWLIDWLIDWLTDWLIQ